MAAYQGSLYIKGLRSGIIAYIDAMQFGMYSGE